MTDDLLSTDWADDRLIAALAARSASQPTPSDLISSTLERVRVAPRPTRGRFRFVHLAGATAAAVVLAVVGIAVLGPRPTTEPGDPLTATFGLEPITVSQAIAIRDAGVDDSELAVSGFLATGVVMFCAAPRESPNPTRVDCASLWLMEQPEVLTRTTRTEPVAITRQPTGPAFLPSFSLVDVTLPSGPRDAASRPVPVTLLGHFDDRRAAFCTADERISCADTFVVDRIAAIDGADVGTTTLLDPETTPLRTDAETDARLHATDPGLRVLSRRVTAIERLSASEPSFNGRRGPASYLRSVVWLVTALPPVDAAGRAVARTFVIPDSAADPAFEITGDGEVKVESTDPPTTSPNPSEAPTTTIVGDPITVADAIDHRDNHLDDTELAIRGYGWSPEFPIPCPANLVDSPALNHCTDNFTWIADQLPSDLGRADGRALNLLLRPDTYLAVDFRGEPVEVIAIGHFDDHRAPQCGADLREQCRRNFVVDALLDPVNPVLELDAIESFRPDPSLTPIATAAEVERFASLLPRGSGFVFAAFPVAGADVETFGPTAAESSAVTSAPVVWVVRYVDPSEEGPPVLKTELVIDARITSLSGSTYVPTRDGLTIELQTNPDCRMNVRCEAVLAAAQSVVSFDNARVVVIGGRGRVFHAEVHVCYADGRDALVDVMGEDLKAVIRDTAWDSPPCR
jgi:hypothetical protein